MAQELEHRNIGDRKQEVEVTEEKRMSLKRYYTVNSIVAESHAEKKYERTKNRRKQPKDEKVIFQAEKRKDLFTQAKESIHATVDTLQAEIEFLDGYRTATMIVWSAGIFTPLYVQIFKLMDWSMPHKTPVTVAARVILSFLISIPLNTAFFTYGTFVHHTAEWLAIKDEWNVHLQDMGVSLETTEQYGSVIPFDWEMMVATAKLKLESELYTTIRDSAKAWVSSFE